MSRRREQLPSMNLVLSNKFNEGMNINEEEYADKFSKSRRQVMRDVLAGKQQPIFGGLQCGSIPSWQ